MSDIIYIPNEYKPYRFVLGELSSRPLFCLGINPSTATPIKLDPTVASVKNRAMLLGYDSYIMLNVYPQRATNPNDLHKNLNRKLHIENLSTIEKLLKSSHPSPHIWLAFGNLIEKRAYLKPCLLDIIHAVKQLNPHWLKCGDITKAGHPHHPLYLNKLALLELFDIENYLHTLNQNN
jgi:hypothetical protein